MTTPTEEELRAMCRTGEGKFSLYMYHDSDGEVWFCNITLPPLSHNATGVCKTKGGAIEKAWEGYVNNKRDPSLS